MKSNIKYILKFLKKLLCFHKTPGNAILAALHWITSTVIAVLDKTPLTCQIHIRDFLVVSEMSNTDIASATACFRALLFAPKY